MVNRVARGGKTFYSCEYCKNLYESIIWAQKCQAWCKEHKSCNINITKNALRRIGFDL